MDIQDISPLSLDLITAEIDDSVLTKLNKIIIHQTTSSTNDVLWERLNSGKTSPAISLAERQTEGRGRRGDKWHSPASGNLYLSIYWPFPAEMAKSGLSIAIGISLINTLKTHLIKDLSIKWPNDILVNRQKLAGILVESRFGTTQNTVVGIGLNFKLPESTKCQINQPTTSLQQLCSSVPCRNRLAGKIIQNMIETIEIFQHRGLTDFLPLWSQYDALDNQAITLLGPDEKFNALACGINEQGELRYLRNNKIETLSNSHIRIRFAS